MCATSRLEPNGFTLEKEKKATAQGEFEITKLWKNYKQNKNNERKKKPSYPKQFVKWRNEINSQVNRIVFVFSV